jgi:hypothetical protein
MTVLLAVDEREKRHKCQCDDNQIPVVGPLKEPPAEFIQRVCC